MPVEHRHAAGLLILSPLYPTTAQWGRPLRIQGAAVKAGIGTPPKATLKDP